MIIKENEFPLLVQAYQTTGTEDRFVAEQVVKSQNEIDSFTSRFAGLLIKAKKISGNELEMEPSFLESRTLLRSNSVGAKRGNSLGVAFFLLILILVVIGFATGWIQRTFNLSF